MAFLAVLLVSAITFFANPGSYIPVQRVLQILLLAAGVAIGWMGVGTPNRSSRQAMRALILAALVLYAVQHLWQVRFWVPIVPQMFLVTAAAVLYGKKDAFLLVGMIALLEFTTPAAPGVSFFGSVSAVVWNFSFISAAALVAAETTSGQRRRIASLREELFRVRSNPFGPPGEEGPGGKTRAVSATRSGVGEELEALDKSLDAILERIREYFRAHSVLLYQLHGSRSIALRHWVSSAPVSSGLIIDLETSLLGRIFSRGVSCNWNLDDPDSNVTLRDIPYYADWQPIRHLAGSPLKLRDQNIGILVVDRTAPLPFTDLELLHIEMFAMQLVEIIEMGKRYREQVDRNTEYRLFYRAMSELSQGLAIEDILGSLARSCQEIVSPTLILIALLDESRSSYEIALSQGAERLKGTKVRSQGRTWLSWMLNSDTGALMLKDVRSHGSRMALASPREGDLNERSLLMLPLVVKERKIGAILLGSTRTDYFQNWQMRILISVCAQAAANIENSLLHRRVENEALTDGLTQLFNHRYFQERLDSEFSRARRAGSKLSLLMTDLDNFKRINDAYGHRIGDIILRQIASVLQRTIRAEDGVARYGGEEFVIILTGSDRKGALRMGERLRAAVEKLEFSADEHAIRITISVGTATFPEDAREPWELIERADRALYRAKEQGRNRVVAFDAGEQKPARLTDLNGDARSWR